MALTKVQETVVFAIASCPSNDKLIGSEVDVSTYYAGFFRVRMGRATSSAFTVGPKWRIEGSYDSSSPTANQWTVLAQGQCAVGASIGSQAVSGTEAAGQTVVTLAAGTNFAAGDYVFFHNTTIGNSEWSRLLSISGADLTLEEGIVNAQTGATARDQAEQWASVLDLTGIQRIRFVVDGAGSGQAVIFQAEAGFVSGL